jgi:hypothetical protein
MRSHLWTDAGGDRGTNRDAISPRESRSIAQTATIERFDLAVADVAGYLFPFEPNVQAEAACLMRPEITKRQG